MKAPRLREDRQQQARADSDLIHLPPFPLYIVSQSQPMEPLVIHLQQPRLDGISSIFK